jgi:endonuclease-3
LGSHARTGADLLSELSLGHRPGLVTCICGSLAPRGGACRGRDLGFPLGLNYRGRFHAIVFLRAIIETLYDPVARSSRCLSHRPPRLTGLTMVRMPPKPKTAAERTARVKTILKILDVIYPNVTCALNHSSPWELLVATILSAQCTDVRVNQVTPGLFKKYPTPQDFAAVSQEELATDIRSTGFFNNKARSVIGAAKKIIGDFGGQVPRTIEELITVPGAARKTANVVLGTSYGVASGVVVDTHVQRISRRLDLTKQTDPVKVEKDLMKIIPPDRWILFSHQIIHLGRQICVARGPRCAQCKLNTVCYSRDRTA